jgi:hypothetical protein
MAVPDLHLEDPATYLAAPDDRFCDVIMKGGVTSGIVYPRALCALAQTFRLKNVGGTSAGAIAAVGAAAAECRRARGSGDGFVLLAGLSTWLGTKPPGATTTNLLSLFRPQRSTRRVFDAAVTAIRHSRMRLFWALVGALRNFPLAALVVALPGLTALALAIAADGSPVVTIVLAILCVVFALVGLVAGALVGFARSAFRLPPGNFFGLCSGGRWRTGLEIPVDRSPTDLEHEPKPLAEWLADLLDVVSGGNAGERPLTFGDLWCAGEDPRPSDEQLRARASRDRVVDLAMITTNLSTGTPYRLPFDWSSWPVNESVFYYDPDEFRRIFPERVVAWMEQEAISAAAPRVQGSITPPARGADGLRRFPDAVHLPLVVAARLSLSFPFLLTMLPLYVYDAVTNGYLRCWFSDGGIASNFPIHFFDSPLPRWPTVGINLRGPRREKAPQGADDLVWLIESYDEGTKELWNDVPDLLGFLGAIKDAMQNWRDNAQQRMPGSRDRIAHIAFDKGEGGLNLSMPIDVIEGLGLRGELAGLRLRERFADEPRTAPISFDSHRWVRYRTAMTALSRAFVLLHRGLIVPPRPPTEPYRWLIGRPLAEPPAYAPWVSTEQRTTAGLATLLLDAAMASWNAVDAFSAGSVRPEPVLRMTPDV